MQTCVDVKISNGKSAKVAKARASRSARARKAAKTKSANNIARKGNAVPIPVK